MANYFSTKNTDFMPWLANFLKIKLRKGSETSGTSNVAYISGVA